MNDGVAMLLERMKTNPEEFVHEGGVHRTKWGQLIDGYKERLDPEDAKALTDGYNALLQQQFTEKVMEELVDPKKLNPYLVQESATLSGGTTQGLYANGIGGNATLLTQHQLQVEHMKAHLEALKKEEVRKPHKTLFGKLFNYQ